MGKTFHGYLSFFLLTGVGINTVNVLCIPWNRRICGSSTRAKVHILLDWRAFGYCGQSLPTLVSAQETHLGNTCEHELAVESKISIVLRTKIGHVQGGIYIRQVEKPL